MKPDLKIVEAFPEGNVANIAAMLRQAADSIGSETDEDNRTEAMIAVQIHEDGDIQVYGWGRTDSVKAIGTLHLGIAQLANGMLKEDL